MDSLELRRPAPVKSFSLVSVVARNICREAVLNTFVRNVCVAVRAFWVLLCFAPSFHHVRAQSKASTDAGLVVRRAELHRLRMVPLLIGHGFAGLLSNSICSACACACVPAFTSCGLA